MAPASAQADGQLILAAERIMPNRGDDGEGIHKMEGMA